MRSAVRFAVVCLMLGAACAAVEEPVPDPAPAIDNEIARLTAELDRLGADEGLPPGIRNLIPGIRKQLDSARAASSPLLRLYRLRGPAVATEGLDFFAEQHAGIGSIADFDALWESQRATFESLESDPQASILGAALSEAALDRAEKLFAASRPYARASQPSSGVYYLSEAEGNRRFAAFVSSLPMERDAEPRPSSTDLVAAHDSLQGETLALFADDPASPAAIPFSARLNEARELIESGRLAGATLTLVEVRLGLSRRNASSAAPAAGAPTGDDSLSLLLLAIAAEEGEQSAAVVRAAVVPFYDSLVGRSS